jgi:hypothetical protein
MSRLVCPPPAGSRARHSLQPPGTQADLTVRRAIWACLAGDLHRPGTPGLTPPLPGRLNVLSVWPAARRDPTPWPPS